MSRKKKQKTGISEPFQQCATILKVLQDRPEASAFLEPVDWEFYGLTDYPEVIKNPMDLGTIQENLESGKYNDVEEFAKEIRLVWKNAMTYNRSDSDIYITAERLSKLFERRFTKVRKTPGGKNRKRKGESQTVTRADRVRLSELVVQLTSDELGQLVDTLQKDCPESLNEEEEEIEIEINNISSDTLTNLNQFCTKCVNSRNSTKARLSSSTSAAVQ